MEVDSETAPGAQSCTYCRYWAEDPQHEDSAMFPRVRSRWMRLGRPPLTEFAPYSAHCLMVDMFFHVAVDKRLIAAERPSNRVDIAYLYYTPFAMMFVSNDKLHRRTAPLLLTSDQLFVFGEDLKRDLAALDAYYSERPDDEREQGLFRLAGYPPEDDAFLTTRIWKRFKMAPGVPRKMLIRQRQSQNRLSASY